jgi:hypothetical protein
MERRLAALFLADGCGMQYSCTIWAHASDAGLRYGAPFLLHRKLHGAGFLVRIPPQEFHVFGFARSKMTDAEFRDVIASTLSCRISARCDMGQGRAFRCWQQAPNAPRPDPFVVALQANGSDLEMDDNPSVRGDTVPALHVHTLGVPIAHMPQGEVPGGASGVPASLLLQPGAFGVDLLSPNSFDRGFRSMGMLEPSCRAPYNPTKTSLVTAPCPDPSSALALHPPER